MAISHPIRFLDEKTCSIPVTNLHCLAEAQGGPSVINVFPREEAAPNRTESARKVDIRSQHKLLCFSKSCLLQILSYLLPAAVKSCFLEILARCNRQLIGAAASGIGPVVGPVAEHK